MSDSWITQRKDIFIRDLFRDFFEAKIYFDSICSAYKKSSFLPFHMLDAWVGTETKKGPLWNLKDQSHRLFRSNPYTSNLYEHLFDWTIGSIFHESMKLKEDSYQIESYKPLLELELNESQYNKELSKIINEYFSLIEKAHKNLKEELQGISELFTKAIFHLRLMLILYKGNLLLLRYLLDNKKSLENIFGKNASTQILQQMFPEGIDRAYVVAAEFCMKNGWYNDAQGYLQQALKVDENHAQSKDLLRKVEEKLHIDKTEDQDT